MPEVIQVTLSLDEPGLLASNDPDPTGARLSQARGRGESSPQLDPLSEATLSGALRLTLTTERAEALAAELFNSLKG